MKAKTILAAIAALAIPVAFAAGEAPATPAKQKAKEEHCKGMKDAEGKEMHAKHGEMHAKHEKMHGKDGKDMGCHDKMKAAKPEEPKKTAG